ncbi:alpha-hydroxy-acid oxidizing protein [Streptomyces sp. NBC_00237]|uniref:alpha-hydroxy-acid oxidizing protein n=1 Tax=Streptomyces sp. NBC_00237 TaxID=2975687 RepID=UPI002253A79F|nr:alpha-hydroxy-acid oxidizing protein [Streptomyces sp. NBC_00237]MCX5205887.1 alpha-hydroxy-acid oxidizing protein [Streptomyces sp. NBC_00237]
MTAPERGYADYQFQIYTRGLQDEIPPFTTDFSALEDVARERIGPKEYWYIAGAAGSGATARANRAAFDRHRIVPRMLRDATARDLRTTVLGEELAAPLVLAPIGVQSLVHPDGELATARAAAATGLPMALSTASSHTIEEVAEANGAEGQRWFQLYWPHDDEVTASILGRARAAGYTVLVVTLDTWQLAWRPHDLDQAYLPFLRGGGVAIPLSDPVFRSRLERPVEEDPQGAAMQWLPIFSGKAHTWDELGFLREHWDGPIVLKGIVHPQDARRAVRAGMDGIVVSNHGGRQVDGAVAALDALVDVVAEVGAETEVLFDSGIRGGSDVFKALALGARAVLLGRPYVYGLALGGAAGIEHVVRGLLADFDLTMGLTGCAKIADIGPDLLHGSGGPGGDAATSGEAGR